MKNKIEVPTNNRSKAIMINMLFAITIIIMLSGVFFIGFSIVNNVYFKVISSEIHGAIFGLLVVYLGVRYFLAVMKLKTELYKNTSKFSWDNFKKKRSIKVMQSSRN